MIEIRTVDGETLASLPAGQARFRSFLTEVARTVATAPPREDGPRAGFVHSLSGVDLEDLGAAAQAAGMAGTLTDEGMVDLRGMDVSGWDLRGMKTGRADLSGASLVACEAAATDLRGSRMTGADISGIDLTGALLGRSDMRDVMACRVPEGHPVLGTMSPESLRGVRYNKMRAILGADMEEADLRGARFEDARFLGASLVRARMGGSTLVRCDLDGADIRETDFRRARVSGCTMPCRYLGTCRAAGATFGGNRYPAYGGLFGVGLLRKANARFVADIKAWPPEIRADFRDGGSLPRRLLLRALGI